MVHDHAFDANPGPHEASTQFLIARGYRGQTTEVFAFPSDPNYPTPIERAVGVPLKSYVTASWTWHFGR